ncbi:unnamed protein product [Paramecium octaurelia]|uniref:Uncharacterized protein n=1 Tax=Paramecium octaurelia TaxID=43137 RepID=A0A8S1YSK7_PAROT|nr:unnamed protein product [Paramecium octaurelia]
MIQAILLFLELETIVKHQYLPPQYTFKKAFVVMADSNARQVALVDISRGRLIRSRQGGHHFSRIYGYHQKDSYFLSYVVLNRSKETKDNLGSIGSDSDSDSEIRKQWLIFDVIRGTEIEIKGDVSSDDPSDIFTKNILMRSQGNKLIYKLKL